jgi:hypothetical protein
LRKQLIILGSAALIISFGLALAQQKTPLQNDKFGAPSGITETPPYTPDAKSPETGQAANFEDRWSAQRETPDRLPTARIPGPAAPRTSDPAALDQGNGNWDPPAVSAPSTQR